MASFLIAISISNQSANMRAFGSSKEEEERSISENAHVVVLLELLFVGEPGWFITPFISFPMVKSSFCHRFHPPPCCRYWYYFHSSHRSDYLRHHPLRHFYCHRHQTMMMIVLHLTQPHSLLPFHFYSDGVINGGLVEFLLSIIGCSRCRWCGNRRRLRRADCHGAGLFYGSFGW